MGDVIATHFITLDGVVSDPDGRGGTDHGGWAFRYGLGPVDDDKFRLGPRMDDGVQLYGRRTWEHFSRLWPSRDGAFAQRMNGVRKRVATRSAIDATAWSNSEAIDGDLLEWIAAARVDHDIVVIGSLSLVHQLAAADVIDEYRLITFPVVAGAGDRLFAEGTSSSFRITAAGLNDPEGVTVLTVLRRDREELDGAPGPGR
jgi:dihydrofolate reductase